MKKKETKSLLSIMLLFFGVVALLSEHSFADTSSRIAARSSSGLLQAGLDVLLLLGILFCFFSSLKVKSFLKDGELAHGWILFSVSFAILFIAQLFSLSASTRLFDIPLTIVSFIRLLSILSLALGIYFMKKVLS